MSLDISIIKYLAAIMRSPLSRAFGTGASRPRPQDAFLSAIQKGGYNQNFHHIAIMTPY
jgi:hypothetical protein